MDRPARRAHRSFPLLQPASPDRMRIEREYRRMAEAQRYPYLERFAVCRQPC